MPRTGKITVHYAHHSQRGIVEGELEGDNKEKIKAAMQETLVSWRLTLRCLSVQGHRLLGLVVSSTLQELCMDYLVFHGPRESACEAEVAIRGRA